MFFSLFSHLAELLLLPLDTSHFKVPPGQELIFCDSHLDILSFFQTFPIFLSVPLQNYFVNAPLKEFSSEDWNFEFDSLFITTGLFRMSGGHHTKQARSIYPEDELMLENVRFFKRPVVINNKSNSKFFVLKFYLLYIYIYT